MQSGRSRRKGSKTCKPGGKIFPESHAANQLFNPQEARSETYRQDGFALNFALGETRKSEVMKHVLVLLLSLFSLCAAPTAADAGARILPDSVAATARTEERRPCVRGRVEDTEGRPVPGVAVVMLDADSAYVAAAASDAEGRFEIVPAVKPYRLLFQHISYELAALSGESGEAGTVTLHERSTGIGAVVVEGERPVVRIEQGRLAYDLQAVVRGKAVNNAYEALTQLPGVSERQGTLTLAGTGSVTVILNGRPTTMDAAQLEALLRSTPVERIEKAEIMYSAPPQYHVRGAAMNLVMRRAAAGTLTGEVHGDYSNRYYGNWEAGGNLVFAAREWSADITYSAGQTQSKRLIDLLSRHTLADRTYDIEQHQNLVSETTAHRLRASAEYAPENKGRVSAAYTASFTPRNAGDSRAEGNFVRSSNRPDGDAAMHNLALRYTTASGTDLALDYTHYRTDNRAAMRNEYADGTKRDFDVASGQRIDRLSFSLDQRHEAGKGWEVTYGALLGWTSDRDWQRYTVLLGDFDAPETDSRLDEWTGNLYAGIGRQFARGSFSLSAAGEYYRLGDYENWSVYPQATFVWMPSAEHVLQLSLASDKSYPSYWEMQGAVSYIDGYSEIHGTPGLRPMRSYEGQAMYVLEQKYIFMLFWNETRDHFQQTAWQASDRLALVYQTLNWDTNRQWGVNAIVPFRIGRWLDSRLTLTGLRMTQRCDAFHDLSFDRSKWIGIVRLDNTVRISRKPDLTLDLAAFCQSPAIQGTYDIDPAWSVDAGLRWNFDRKRASLTVRCDDLFESGVPFARVRYRGQWLDMDSGAYSRTFTVHFSYRFGSYKERKHKEVDTSRFGH